MTPADCCELGDRIACDVIARLGGNSSMSAAELVMALTRVVEALNTRIEAENI